MRNMRKNMIKKSELQPAANRHCDTERIFTRTSQAMMEDNVDNTPPRDEKMSMPVCGPHCSTSKRRSHRYMH